MLHIAICDDQANHIKKIRSAVEYYTTKQNIDVDIRKFNNPLVFLKGLDRSGAADILLLDICMPGVLGTEVAKEIRQRGDKTESPILYYHEPNIQSVHKTPLAQLVKRCFCMLGA